MTFYISAALKDVVKALSSLDGAEIDFKQTGSFFQKVLSGADDEELLALLEMDPVQTQTCCSLFSLLTSDIVQKNVIVSDSLIQDLKAVSISETSEVLKKYFSSDAYIDAMIDCIATQQWQLFFSNPRKNTSSNQILLRLLVKKAANMPADSHIKNKALKIIDRYSDWASIIAIISNSDNIEPWLDMLGQQSNKDWFCIEHLAATASKDWTSGADLASKLLIRYWGRERIDFSRISESFVKHLLETEMRYVRQPDKLLISHLQKQPPSWSLNKIFLRHMATILASWDTMNVFSRVSLTEMKYHHCLLDFSTKTQIKDMLFTLSQTENAADMLTLLDGDVNGEPFFHWLLSYAYIDHVIWHEGIPTEVSFISTLFGLLAECGEKDELRARVKNLISVRNRNMLQLPDKNALHYAACSAKYFSSRTVRQILKVTQRITPQAMSKADQLGHTPGYYIAHYASGHLKRLLRIFPDALITLDASAWILLLRGKITDEREFPLVWKALLKNITTNGGAAPLIKAIFDDVFIPYIMASKDQDNSKEIIGDNLKNVVQYFLDLNGSETSADIKTKLIEISQARAEAHASLVKAARQTGRDVISYFWSQVSSETISHVADNSRKALEDRFFSQIEQCIQSIKAETPSIEIDHESAFDYQSVDYDLGEFDSPNGEKMYGCRRG